MPAEAAEALLELATGGKPRVAQRIAPITNPFEHPDAQRRFRVMTNVEELQQALDFPWEKWTVFLHPEQRQWVDRDYNGPARISVFNGPPPSIQIFTDKSQEQSGVVAWLAERSKDGILPHECGMFVRSEGQLKRAMAAVNESGLPFKILDEHVETASGHVSISTMHLAKGLEFRAVVVMACDDEIIPSQERIETVGDDTDLQEVYDTERQLLCVACTRARDQLLITSASSASEFLDDLQVG